MINEELLDYIKEQLDQGVDKEEIKSKLIANGWAEADVNEALALVAEPASTPQSSVPSAPSYSPETSFDQKPKSNLVKIFIGVFIILILGVVASLAARIWDPLWNPFRPGPEEAIARMAVKMGNLNYLHSEMKIEISGQEDGQKAFSFLINYTGDSDNSDPKEPKTAGDFNVTGSSDGIQLTVGGESRIIGDISYIKLTTLPVIPEMPIDFTGIKNQWLKIDSEFGQAPEMQLMFGSMIEVQIEVQKEIQKEMQEKLEKLLVDKNLYLIKRELPDGKVGDQKVYGYLIALNNEKMKEIFLEMLEIYMEIYFEKTFSLLFDIEMFPEELRPSPAEIAEMETEMEMAKEEAIKEMEKELGEFFEKIGDIEGELWIGKKDFYLYRIKMEKEIDLAKIEPTDKRKILIKFDMDSSNFNKPVKIEPPEEYRDFEEVFIPLLMEIIENSMEKARLRAKDARIMANMSQLRAGAKIHFSSQRRYSYTNFCTSKDTSFIKKDIITQGGMNFACHVQTGAGAGKSYCIEVQLNSGDWWCIDHSGRAKQYTSNPACAICIGKSCQCE